MMHPVSATRLITYTCLGIALVNGAPSVGPSSFNAAKLGYWVQNRDVASTSVTRSPVDVDQPLEVDVVVVGGGYSGLMSAYTLHEAGLKTVVLEAKERLGGKVRSHQFQNRSGVIELGATWINKKTQPDVYALTQKFELETAEQYTDGDSVFQGIDGQIWRMPQNATSNTNDNLTTLLEGKIYGLIDEASKQIDLRDFEAFPKEQDFSVEQWFALKGLWKFPHARGIVSQLTSSLVGRQPDEIGAHYFFDYIQSGGGLLELGSEGEFGAQSLKIKKGTSAIATALADAISSENIYLDSAVKSITQTNDSTLVTARTNQAFRAKKVILANPTNTYAGIKFSPPLPEKKQYLTSHTKAGVYAKLIISYADPWWRNAGLVGKFTSHVGPVCFSWDTSDMSASQYSLAIFVAGDIAARWHILPDSARQEAIIEHLATLVGEDLADSARDVLEVNYVEWTKEEYLGGAPTNSLGPKMLREYGEVLREPFGSIHFGGGDTAYEWKGYLEGAIRAGQRAAKEITDALDF